MKEGKMAKALADIKVLDFTQALAGLYCTLLLKDLMAELESATLSEASCCVASVGN